MQSLPMPTVLYNYVKIPTFLGKKSGGDAILVQSPFNATPETPDQGSTTMNLNLEFLHPKDFGVTGALQVMMPSVVQKCPVHT